MPKCEKLRQTLQLREVEESIKEIRAKKCSRNEITKAKFERFMRKSSEISDVQKAIFLRPILYDGSTRFV